MNQLPPPTNHLAAVAQRWERLATTLSDPKDRELIRAIAREIVDKRSEQR